MTEETKPVEEKKLPTVDEAQAIVELAQRQRVARCKFEVDAVVAKYGLRLVPRPVFTLDGRVSAAIDFAEALKQG